MEMDEKSEVELPGQARKILIEGGGASCGLGEGINNTEKKYKPTSPSKIPLKL